MRIVCEKGPFEAAHPIARNYNVLSGILLRFIEKVGDGDLDTLLWSLGIAATANKRYQDDGGPNCAHELYTIGRTMPTTLVR